jgi:hypothetical protein
MNKEYIIRRLTSKGKLKTPLYDDGQPVAEWRTFKSESDALEFVKLYELNDILILPRFVNPVEEIHERFD